MAVTSNKGKAALKGSSKLNTLPGFNEPKAPTPNPYGYTHTDTDKETRSKRVYFLIKPSANQQLDEMVKRGEIISKNDLVNKLIDNFLRDYANNPDTSPDQLTIEDIE